MLKNLSTADNKYDLNRKENPNELRRPYIYGSRCFLFTH